MKRIILLLTISFFINHCGAPYRENSRFFGQTLAAENEVPKDNMRKEEDIKRRHKYMIALGIGMAVIGFVISFKLGRRIATNAEGFAGMSRALKSWKKSWEYKVMVALERDPRVLLDENNYENIVEQLVSDLRSGNFTRIDDDKLLLELLEKNVLDPKKAKTSDSKESFLNWSAREGKRDLMLSAIKRENNVNYNELLKLALVGDERVGKIGHQKLQGVNIKGVHLNRLKAYQLERKDADTFRNERKELVTYILKKNKSEIEFDADLVRHAIRGGHIDIVKEIIDLNISKANNATLLKFGEHLVEATALRRYDVVNLLLEKMKELRKSLAVAIEESLKEGTAIPLGVLMGPYQQDALLVALARSDLDIAYSLMSNGADLYTLKNFSKYNYKFASLKDVYKKHTPIDLLSDHKRSKLEVNGITAKKILDDFINKNQEKAFVLDMMSYLKNILNNISGEKNIASILKKILSDVDVQDISAESYKLENFLEGYYGEAAEDMLEILRGNEAEGILKKSFGEYEAEDMLKILRGDEAEDILKKILRGEDANYHLKSSRGEYEAKHFLTHDLDWGQYEAEDILKKLSRGKEKAEGILKKSFGEEKTNNILHFFHDMDVQRAEYILKKAIRGEKVEESTLRKLSHKEGGTEYILEKAVRGEKVEESTLKDYFGDEAEDILKIIRDKKEAKVILERYFGKETEVIMKYFGEKDEAKTVLELLRWGEEDLTVGAYIQRMGNIVLKSPYLIQKREEEGIIRMIAESRHFISHVTDTTRLDTHGEIREFVLKYRDNPESLRDLTDLEKPEERIELLEKLVDMIDKGELSKIIETLEQYLKEIEILPPNGAREGIQQTSLNVIIPHVFFAATENKYQSLAA